MPDVTLHIDPNGFTQQILLGSGQSVLVLQVLTANRRFKVNSVTYRSPPSMSWGFVNISGVIFRHSDGVLLAETPAASVNFPAGDTLHTSTFSGGYQLEANTEYSIGVRLGREDGYVYWSVTPDYGSPHNHTGTDSVNFSSIQHRYFHNYNAYSSANTNPGRDHYGFSINYTSNTAPNTPTSLSRTSPSTDTTPVFQCNVLDSDPGDSCKARFEIWNSAMSSMIGSVDSAFVPSGSGTVTAEYASALATGSYNVRAKAIDAAGVESGYTSFVGFTITTSVTQDDTYLWAIRQTIQRDNASFRWDVIANQLRELALRWDIIVPIAPKDLTLLWESLAPWERVNEDYYPPTWEEVIET